MRTDPDPWSCAPVASVRRRAQAGFSLFQALLALVVIAAGVGVWIKFWVQDHQVQSVQRQADVLQTARLAGQRLVVHYRDKLLSGAALTHAIDGSGMSASLLPTGTSAAAGVTTVSWTFEVASVVLLKLLDASFPERGVHGSLSNAKLLLNLTATTLTPSSASGMAPSTQVRGTVCYDRPLVRDGQPDGLALSTLMAQVSRNVGVVGTGGASTSYQSGVFAITMPNDPTQLLWSGGRIPLPSGITPAVGLVCGLVGDWGGSDATGRAAFTTVKLNDTCTEPNALAWLSPTGGATPQHIVWCNGSQWKLFKGGDVGQTCSVGQMAFNNADLRPLWCSTFGTFVLAYAPPIFVPGPGALACNSSNSGMLAVRLGSGAPMWCDGSVWQSGLPQLAFVTTGVTIGATCNIPGGLGVNTLNNLLYCDQSSGVWVKLN